MELDDLEDIINKELSYLSFNVESDRENLIIVNEDNRDTAIKLLKKIETAI